MSERDDSLRRSVDELIRRTRVDRGLPRKIEDPTVIRAVARKIARAVPPAPERAGRSVA